MCLALRPGTDRVGVHPARLRLGPLCRVSGFWSLFGFMQWVRAGQVRANSGIFGNTPVIVDTSVSVCPFFGSVQIQDRQQKWWQTKMALRKETEKVAQMAGFGAQKKRLKGWQKSWLLELRKETEKVRGRNLGFWS
jgi:hypothetical protein